MRRILVPSWTLSIVCWPLQRYGTAFALLALAGFTLFRFEISKCKVGGLSHNRPFRSFRGDWCVDGVNPYSFWAFGDYFIQLASGSATITAPPHTRGTIPLHVVWNCEVMKKVSQTCVNGTVLVYGVYRSHRIDWANDISPLFVHTSSSF